MDSTEVPGAVRCCTTPGVRPTRPRRQGRLHRCQGAMFSQHLVVTSATLVVTGATLVVTSALLVVTMFAIRNNVLYPLPVFTLLAMASNILAMASFKTRNMLYSVLPFTKFQIRLKLCQMCVSSKEMSPKI